MSEAEELRRGLEKRRDRLAKLQRDETASARSVEELEQQLAAVEKQLDQQRRRRELLAQHAQHEEAGIAAIQAAITVLTERLPVEEEVEEQEPPEEPVIKPGQRLPANPTALRILADAEVLDLGALSQRQEERAEAVREVLAASEDPVAQQAIIEALLAAKHSVAPTEEKATTAVRVGLTVLVAEGRARCRNSQYEIWALAPSERASANLGVEIANFKGRTTKWPGQNTRPVKPGTLIQVESGSYEGGKKR